MTREDAGAHARKARQRSRYHSYHGNDILAAYWSLSAAIAKAVREQGAADATVVALAALLFEQINTPITVPVA